MRTFLFSAIAALTLGTASAAAAWPTVLYAPGAQNQGVWPYLLQTPNGMTQQVDPNQLPPSIVCHVNVTLNGVAGNQNPALCSQQGPGFVQQGYGYAPVPVYGQPVIVVTRPVIIVRRGRGW